MIAGIGSDIVSVARLREILMRNGDVFAEKVFTASELNYVRKFRDPAEHLAGRWAAKEALAKALGTGFGEYCNWLDINIENDWHGKPVMTLTGTAQKTLEGLPAKKIHLSISHERDYACAFVVLEN